MDGPDARALLQGTERLRRRARADRHPSSVPLLVFAYLTLFGAPLAMSRLWVLLALVLLPVLWLSPYPAVAAGLVARHGEDRAP